MLFLPLVLTLSGCATNPVTGESELHLVPEQQEIEMGREQYPYQIQMAGGDYALLPELSDYVNRVGQKIARVSDRPGLPYEFTVVNDGTWNAWALPGGKIAINRGLLQALETESQLAAVLAHEIVHAAARHSAKQMERGLGMQAVLAGLTLAVEEDLQNTVQQTGAIAVGFTQLKYSRDAEREADQYGIRYMIKAGYDPQGAVELQQLFADNQESAGGWLSSHPASIERVRNLRDQLESGGNVNGYVGASEYRVRTRQLSEWENVYATYEKGVEALRNNDPKTALERSMEARNALPEEALFYGLSAQAYEQLDNPEAALQAWSQAIQRNPDWFLFRLKRGMLHEKLGHRQQAANDYAASKDLLPTEAAQKGLARVTK